MTLAVFEGAEDQLRRPDGVTGGSNTKDAEPPAQPLESPAEPDPGHPATTHQALGPTPGEHPEALATSTTQGAGTPTEAQVEAQTARPAHDGRLSTLDGLPEAPLASATSQVADTSVEAQAETQSSDPSHDGRFEPETCKALEEAGGKLKVEHQSGDTASGPISERSSCYDCAKNRLAGCAKGAKLLHDGQNDANARQDYPIEIDDSPLHAPVRSVRKRRMEDDAAADTPPSRRKLRQNPPKASRPRLIIWKEALSEASTTGSRRSMLERVEDMCQEDDQARSKELKRVRKEILDARKEIRGLHSRLDELWSMVEYLKEQEDDAREQGIALRRLPADHLD